MNNTFFRTFTLRSHRATDLVCSTAFWDMYATAVASVLVAVGQCCVIIDIIQYICEKGWNCISKRSSPEDKVTSAEYDGVKHFAGYSG